MGKYVGFDTVRVALLKRRLAETPDAATTLSGEVHRARDRMNVLAVQAVGLRAHNLGLDRPQPHTPLDGLGPVAAHAGDTATEIGRRLTHLQSCAALAEHGFTFTADNAFADLPPMNAEKVREALADVEAALAEEDPMQALALMDLADDIHGLNAGETDALVAQLSDAQLTEWSESLTVPYLSVLSVFPNEGRSMLANDLFSRLSPEQVLRVSELMPGIQPWLTSDHRDAEFGPTVVDLENATLEDISQGALGDCWFLASIAAELRVDPDFVQKHVVENENGTFTVTFYDNGEPVEITVDNQVTDVYAQPGWVAVYEKAFAQYTGSYHGIEGGYGDEGMEVLTGESAVRMDEDDLTLEEMRLELEAGNPITYSTNQASTGALWWKEDKDTFDVGDDTVVSNHVYTVIDVDPANDRVTLRNPWGSGASADEYITMSLDELDDHFDNLAVG